MLKMGVKKKHETFEENSLNEPAKSNRIPTEWLRHNRQQQSPRSIQSAQHTVNGESNYLNKHVELLELTHGVNTTNKSYNNSYLVYERENMSSAGESKTKHTQRSTYLNKPECNTNTTIIISDEEDDDDDMHRSHHAHNQEINNGKF